MVHVMGCRALTACGTPKPPITSTQTSARVQNRGLNLGAQLHRDQEWKFQRGSSRYATRDYMYCTGNVSLRPAGGPVSVCIGLRTNQVPWEEPTTRARDRRGLAAA